MLKIAQAILAFIRYFYQGQPRSTNKFYINDDAPLTSMQERRNQKAELAAKSKKFYKLQNSKERTDDMFIYGLNVLTQKEYRFGNCQEMASLALYLFLDKDFGNAWMCKANRRGRHWFCIVGSKQSVAPRYASLSEFENDRSELIIIDPWMNICCYLREYKSLARKKCLKWQTNHRYILSENFIDAMEFFNLLFKDNVEYFPGKISKIFLTLDQG